MIHVHKLGLVFGLGGQGEEVAETMVEALGEAASQLKVLELVFADGDELGVVEENIGRHQHGIVKNPDVDAVFAFAFVLILGHTVKFAHGGDAVQDPAEFGMGGDARLAIEVDVGVEIETGGEEVFEGL